MNKKHGIDWCDSEDENVEISRKLMEHLKEVAIKMHMSDWDLRLAYNPKPDGSATMEVDTDNAEYKIVTITVFKLKSHKVMDDCFVHELLHAKVGTLLKHYTMVIDNQKELLQDLAGLHEEKLMEDLVGVIQKCTAKKV